MGDKYLEYAIFKINVLKEPLVKRPYDSITKVANKGGLPGIITRKITP